MLQLQVASYVKHSHISGERGSRLFLANARERTKWRKKLSLRKSNFKNYLGEKLKQIVP